jgi:ABC-type branched-subunit amino acid transport system substrate-binding protein
MKSYTYYFSIAIILILFSSLNAQNAIQREREILNKNIEFYRSGKYEKAEQNFSLMVSRLPNSMFITTNHLMLIKSQYKNDHYSEAINSAKEFLKSHPSSKYRDDVYYAMGNSYYQLQRYSTAVNTWEKALNESPDNRMIERLSYLITESVKYKLSSEELNKLFNEVNSPDGQLLLSIGFAEKYIAQGSISAATDKLQSSVNAYPQSQFTPRAKKLLETGSIGADGQERIALLLPLTGFNEQIGTEMREGAELALEEFNQGSQVKVELMVRDYSSEITTALGQYKDLAKDRSVLAVLGPIENDISAACAAISDYEKLALVSPTATDGEIANLTDQFFQLNSTLIKRAEVLGSYAVDSLKIKRFATFSPVDRNFVKMVDRFSEVVVRDTQEVVSQEWYYAGDQDVNKQFMRIKRAGLRLTFMDSLLHEDPSLDKSHTDSLYRLYQEGQIELLEETETKIDSADIPVVSIDGMFVPIYKEDIKFIAPQIAYSNIQTQLLGNGDWYDVEELKKNKNYINGLIFVTCGYLDDENWDYRQFRNKFRTAKQKTPTTYNLIGYDTMKFMLSPLQNVSITLSRETYTRNLQQVRTYNGIYRSLEMDDNNCNVRLQLIKYDYGQMIPLN